MKKIILIALICGFTFTSFSQKFVIKRVDADSISYEITQIIKTVNHQFKLCSELTNNAKFGVDTSEGVDSLEYENVWNGYINALNNIRLTVIDQFKESDTIFVAQIGDEYYLNNDTLGLSINERKLVLKNRHERLVSKYGVDKVNDSVKGSAIVSEFNQLTDYQNQLK